MKPLNLDNNSCSPISSNCVIWQGPNIPCIKLCTGDSITDVIYALATELCNIVDQVDISTLDLSCLDITTGEPANLNELLQILINKICSTNSIPVPAAFTTDGNPPCPTTCVVPVAQCLQTNGQTTMKLLDYVQLIGNRICSILASIGTINNSITNLTTRVTNLESVPPTPPYILPSVKPDCTLADGTVVSGTAYKLDIILEALINDNNHGYCALVSSTGQPSEITQAYLSQPIFGTNVALSQCNTTLAQKFGTSWFTSPDNLSKSFTDLWLTVKDLRDAYKTYTVVSGNSNVTVTPTTNVTACGPELQFAVKAKGSSVIAGSNITVTSNTVDGNTAYTVNANVKNTKVVAGDNITVAENTTNPLETIYTVTGKETIVTAGNNITVTPSGPVGGDMTYTIAGKESIVQASTNEGNTITVTPVTGPGADDTTYNVYSQYGLEMFGCQWSIKNTTAGSWMTMPSQTSDAATQFAFPNSEKRIIKPNSITTTSTLDNKTYSLSRTQTEWYVAQVTFDSYGNTFGTFDINTGFFEITEPGAYLISAFAHLKPNSFGNTVWTSNPGSFGIGLCANDTDLYCGQTQTFVPGVTRQIDLTVQKVIYKAGTTATPIYMSVLNYSDRNYNGSAYVGGDNIGFSIVKLRSDMTPVSLL